MQTNSCSVCGEPLLDSAQRCTGCGMDSLSSDKTISLKKKSSRPQVQHADAAQTKWYEPSDTTMTIRLFRKEGRAGLVQEVYEMAEDDEDDELIERHETWQKVVEHKTPPTLPIVVLPHARTGTFHSLLPRFPRRRVSPRLFFWLSLMILLALLLGGTFGVALSFGREAPRPTVILNQSAIQASPSTIALGGIITLRGTHFTPASQITFSHDQQLPLADTGNTNSVQADTHGNFSDTFIIGPSWSSGVHTLYATIASIHQQIATKITVTGQSALQGPPHLLLSSNTINLGNGDEATNANKLLALSNAGGSQINWQATINEPWLQISPKSGSIASGETMTAIVAVERANLAPGSYSANIIFTSNTEQSELSVNIQVIPLQPAHQAILQLSTAALTFTGTAGGLNPSDQTITVNNPGVRPLNWGASVSLQGYSGWLSVEQSAGSVEPGYKQTLDVSVNTIGLPAGVYKGTITFANTGSVAIQGGSQSIYVSLTITPMCTLNFAPTGLSFIGTAGQAAPPAQSLHITVARGCTTSQHWKATINTVTGGKWLAINQTSGETSSQIQVSVKPTAMIQGTYTGTLTFTASTGPQVVPITFILKPVPCALTGTGAITEQGTAGQSALATGSATLNTTGSCPHTLNWTTSSNVPWLSVTPSGSLTQPATATVNVQANLTGLTTNTYIGTVTVIAVDSTNNQLIGTLQIALTLTVLAPPPPCTLQAVAISTLTFSASVGVDPTAPTQSFTLGVSGTCSGSVTITPSASSSGGNWLAITPTPTTVSSGGQATFTATVSSSTLAAGTYSGTITLVATDNNGAIAGSPQTMNVTLSIQ